ncbi:MAG: hypothetical protein K2X86_04280 [Cytophagaceae bacterium]|nr:hypothetical protein [Cytophagaceae bacterium]
MFIIINSLELEIEITREDYAGFTMYFYYQKNLKKRIVFWTAPAFIIPLIATFKNFDIYSYLILTLVCGSIFAIFFIFSYILIYFWAKKIPLKNGFILGKRKINITDEFYIETSDKGKGEFIWNAFRSVEENKK